MIAIRGYSSSMAQRLLPLLPDWETAIPVERGSNNTEAERHLFCNGLIMPKRMIEMTPGEMLESWQANAGMTISQCNMILAVNPSARIVVIGSESGFAWSYDDCYAASKAALHRYVETKPLKPQQQLVCIAPSIIGDSRMTRNRTDTDNLRRREMQHPKQRHLSMAEVCRMIHFLLYVDLGFVTGTTIRMNGGGHLK